jgi:MEMO1 family protein
MSVRRPAVAGMFYPKEEDKLVEFARYAIDSSPNFGEKPRIIISPHAGFIYSGYTAGYAFRQLQNLKSDTEYKVLIMGPSHKVYLDSAAFSPDGYFEIPSGEIKVDIDESKRLADIFPSVITSAIPHKLEHSLEVQLPFLQLALKNFSIVPLVYGNIGEDELLEILEEFLLDNSRIVIISSDLSHYYPHKEAIAIDSYCIKGVEGLNLEAMGVCQACGKPAITAAVKYALKHNLKSKTLDYKTSGDTTGDKDSVVGYGSFMFYKEGQ